MDDRKWPFSYTLIGVVAVCGLIWFGVAKLIGWLI
ncbi:hypothetical protein AEAC466_17205 [Asticcacaulis sp. AC466]|nr:hypothetical protein AEAC466_17205 [Asticcacaulis sp. AC466]